MSHCLCGCLRLIPYLIGSEWILYVSLPLRLSPINSPKKRFSLIGSNVSLPLRLSPINSHMPLSSSAVRPSHCLCGCLRLIPRPVFLLKEQWLASRFGEPPGWGDRCARGVAPVGVDRRNCCVISVCCESNGSEFLAFCRHLVDPSANDVVIRAGMRGHPTRSPEMQASV